jgi:hypothetical protein
VTPENVYRQRKAWARDLLVRTWGRVEELARIAAVVPDEVSGRADQAMREACAIAEEWGLDPRAIVQEASEAAMAAREASRGRAR